MSDGRRAPLGLLGGTFDPVHYGHLAIAEQTRETLGLERVLFIPAARPPHKPDQPITAVEHRVAMVELAIADADTFALGRHELDRPGPSYAADTVIGGGPAERGRGPRGTHLHPVRGSAGGPAQLARHRTACCTPAGWRWCRGGATRPRRPPGSTRSSRAAGTASSSWPGRSSVTRHPTSVPVRRPGGPSATSCRPPSSATSSCTSCIDPKPDPTPDQRSLA